MLYLWAFLVIVLVAVLCWKAFGPRRSAPGSRQRSAPGSRSARTRVMGPDDDPEFLWRISRPHNGDREPGSAE